MKLVIKSALAGAVAFGGIFGFCGAGSVSAASTFKDVPASHWAKQAIDAAVSKGYFKGYADGTFRPSDKVTRAEFATLMARVSNNKLADGQGSFPDVHGHWAESGIKKAVGMGFISTKDYPKGFKPGTLLTRREMAQWMASGLAAKHEDFRQALSDTKDTLLPIVEYHKGGLNKSDYPYVAVALGTGLMTGYSDGNFAPNNQTTRAEVAVILARYEKVQNNNPGVYQDLKEMREVGLTGTNLLSATPYRYNLSYDDKLESFDRIANKPYTMLYNRGTMTIHRIIAVDAISATKQRNLYGQMFMDKDFDLPVQKDFYNFFFEVTVVPHDHESLKNTNFSTSTLYNFTKGMSFSSGTLDKYGITALPRYDFIKRGFFKKDVPRRFWMQDYVPREFLEEYYEQMGKGDTSVSFSIPRPD